ncbi:RimK family alpha-L-glutamate ligase [Synoicihabitans lomoniglobus]|uniref:RimK family alpha-L-glutamate ligase n=1 Tax=Synoicihabitans lomoniglobus TaxID=2909285 RepID=A0AAE9ZV48_9BACT|nr:RimK family alpha-L-glutamate ligase [Opitutaceae bacterium LMO-M01]WED63941.1 RimK family alpha-L-glutamate ligase [Opitutaceae bacterium LMO-M01]
MKIALLTREPNNYSSRRLKEAATARGHKIIGLNVMKMGIHLDRLGPTIVYGDKELSSYDAVIPRIGASVTFYGTAVVRQFEQMGVFTLNGSHPITVSRDKLRSLQILSRYKLGMPATAFVRDRKQILPAIEQVGGAPVVIKLLEGTQGIGVILADSTKIAEAIIETLQSTKQQVIIQKFVAESKGKDVRAFVIGDRVVAAMRRSAVGTEFRSNVHRGGTTQAITLPPEYEATAVRAAHILGLRVAGVDMLEGADGPQIMEVNSSPGLEGIETATGIDIAGEIIKHLEDHVRFAEFDIRQRLTLARGYQVAELPVGPDSELVGKTVKESNLREKDIVVLSIQRGSTVIPNPRNDRPILAGDVLVCYGLKAALQNMVPHLQAQKRPDRPGVKKKKKKSESPEAK